MACSRSYASGPAPRRSPSAWRPVPTARGRASAAYGVAVRTDASRPAPRHAQRCGGGAGRVRPQRGRRARLYLLNHKRERLSLMEKEFHIRLDIRIEGISSAPAAPAQQQGHQHNAEQWQVTARKCSCTPVAGRAASCASSRCATRAMTSRDTSPTRTSIPSPNIFGGGRRWNRWRNRWICHVVAGRCV